MRHAFTGFGLMGVLLVGCDAGSAPARQDVSYEGPYWHVEDTTMAEAAARCDDGGEPVLEHDTIYTLDARFVFSCDDGLTDHPLWYSASEFHARIVDRDRYVLTRMVPVGKGWRDLASTQQWANYAREDTGAPGWELKKGDRDDVLVLRPLGDPRLPSEGHWQVEFEPQPAAGPCPRTRMVGEVADIFLEGQRRSVCRVQGTLQFVPLVAEPRNGQVFAARMR